MIMKGRWKLILVGTLGLLALLLFRSHVSLADKTDDASDNPKLAADSELGSVTGNGINPPVPPRCSQYSTGSFSDTPQAAINDNATTNVVISVSGLDTYLFDVNLRTNIVHTFAADLEITLISPAGTVVTVTTDNGGGNDDVFDGTLWDDDADVPVTDASYSNGVTTTPLVVEEALAAFRGEDPNGDWTLSVTDDASLDTGTINAWGLDFMTLLAAPANVATTNFSNTTAVAITDMTTVTSTITVTGLDPYLYDVDLETFIVHTFAADLEVTLTSPAGTVSTVTTDNGGSNDDVFNGTVWDDSAGTPVTDAVYSNGVPQSNLVVEEALGAFVGEDPNGTWTLTIFDDAGLDQGSLDEWYLDITTALCAPTDVALTGFSGESTGRASIWLLAGLAFAGTAVLILRRRRSFVA